MEREVGADSEPSAAMEINYDDYEDPYDQNYHAEVSTYKPNWLGCCIVFGKIYLFIYETLFMVDYLLKLDNFWFFFSQI